MSCLTPLTLVREYQTSNGSNTDVVPCGRCPKCLQRRRSQWVFRLSEEKKISDTAYFLTLTYDEDHLPYSSNGYPTLVKKHHQDFMKRLRKHIATYKPDDIQPVLKYYAVGEYGTQTHRPHYHSIIFNLPSFYSVNEILLSQIWSHGHVRVDNAEAASMSYVAGYCMKQMRLDGIDELDDRQLEFSMMSKKMGISYLTAARQRFYKNQELPYMLVEDGLKMSMPRYFREKLYDKQTRTRIGQAAKEYAEQKDVYYSEQHKLEYIKHQFDQQKKLVKLNRKTL